MGSSGGGGYSVQQNVVKAEETVTPAVARSAANVESAQVNQAASRARLKGIRSTYNRFAGSSGEAGSNGSASKLG